LKLMVITDYEFRMIALSSLRKVSISQ